jgi:TorA maturation chaperone TorD
VETLSSEMENARAEVYRFLGTLLTESLSIKNLSRILNVETLSHLKALFPDQEVHQVLEELVDDFSQGHLTAEDIMLDFEALLRVPGPAYIHPYESSYLSRKKREDRMQWGPLNGPQARAAQRLYQNEHLSVRSELADFPDHIGVELEFMAQLCRKVAEALQTGDQKTATEKRERQKHFFQEHLLNWPQALAKEMRSKAETIFYRCLADLLSNFLDMEKSFLVSESKN